MKELTLDRIDAIARLLREINSIGELLSCFGSEETISAENLQHLGYTIYNKSGEILEELKQRCSERAVKIVFISISVSIKMQSLAEFLLQLKLPKERPRKPSPVKE